MSGDSQKLLELAEKIEKAQGPDRELDAEIAVAVDARPDWLRSDTRALINASRGHVSAGIYGPGFEALEYSASLDAALTLVPEGMYWSITRGLDDVGQPVDASSAFSAMINGEPWCDNARRVWARSPALALCAATLRARAAI